MNDSRRKALARAKRLIHEARRLIDETREEEERGLERIKGQSRLGAEQTIDDLDDLAALLRDIEHFPVEGEEKRRRR